MKVSSKKPQHPEHQIMHLLWATLFSLTAGPAFADTVENWQLSIGAGTMPTCLFSDSGLGSNESAFGRIYCHYGVFTTLRTPFQKIFIRAGRSLLSASDSTWNGDKFESGLGQSIFINSLTIGKEFSFSSLHLGIGLGGFNGKSDITREEATGDQIDRTHRSFDISGLTLYSHFRVPFYRSENYSFDLVGYIYQFQTKKIGSGYPAYDMTTLPTAEFSWVMDL